MNVDLSELGKLLSRKLNATTPEQRRRMLSLGSRAYSRLWREMQKITNNGDMLQRDARGFAKLRSVLYHPISLTAAHKDAARVLRSLDDESTNSILDALKNAVAGQGIKYKGYKDKERALFALIGKFQHIFNPGVDTVKHMDWKTRDAIASAYKAGAKNSKTPYINHALGQYLHGLDENRYDHLAMRTTGGGKPTGWMVYSNVLGTPVITHRGIASDRDLLASMKDMAADKSPIALPILPDMARTAIKSGWYPLGRMKFEINGDRVDKVILGNRAALDAGTINRLEGVGIRGTKPEAGYRAMGNAWEGYQKLQDWLKRKRG